MSVTGTSVVPAWYLFAHLPPPMLYLCVAAAYDNISITKKNGGVVLFLLHDLFLIGCTLLVNTNNLYIGLTMVYYALFFTMCIMLLIEVEYIKYEYIIRQKPPRKTFYDKNS